LLNCDISATKKRIAGKAYIPLLKFTFIKQKANIVNKQNAYISLVISNCKVTLSLKAKSIQKAVIGSNATQQNFRHLNKFKCGKKNKIGGRHIE
jgi:hypothetical protein